MPYQVGVYSDVVVSAAGVPVPGALVTMYAVSNWGNGVLPTGSPPSPSPSGSAFGSVVTDSTGSFSFRGVPVDDYHVLVSYTPPGGAAVVTWRYNIAVGPEGTVARAVKRGLGAGLARTLSKLAQGQGATILCVGDGVTVGYNATGTVSGGWVALLCQKLAAAFPTSSVVRYDPSSYGVTSDAPIPGWSAVGVQSGTFQTINVVNSGVTGDTCLRAIRRLGNFTAPSWYPPPDCYIVSLGAMEVASGNTQQATAADFESGLIGLLSLLRANGAEAVVMTPATNVAPVLGGVFDDFANAARAAAIATGSSLVDVRQAFLDQYNPAFGNDGFGTWMNTGGGDHINPTDAGHAAIAAEVFKAFDVLSELPLYGRLGPGLDVERVLILNTSAVITFTGTWAALAQANNYSGRDYTSSTVGDHLDFSARFTDLYLIARRWKDAGQLTVTVDGALVGVIDLYRANPVNTSDVGDFNTAVVPRDRIPLISGLADVVHTVRLQVAATHNASSSGFACRIDAIEMLRLREAQQVVESVAPLQLVQSGVVNVNLAASSSGSLAQIFPVAYNNPPQVFVTAAQGTYDYIAFISAPTKTAVTIGAGRRDGSAVTATIPVHWLAIGN
jgi:lysophospholipase L1-like esterase